MPEDDAGMRNPNIPDVYDAAEVAAMCQFQAAWDVAAEAIPDDYPSLSEVQALPEWEQLRSTAEFALKVFMKRGEMPEDREVVSPRCHP